MARSSIGQFIAALRKASGMTQQEVADRLNISNKAVSRWERDECAPDISLIPALAELFGVTCDELLKGERIFAADTAERKEQKVDRQVRSLINRTLSSFMTLIWIAIALSVVGLILMFGIAYGFYRPVIGFFVMLLFEACAALLTLLAISRAKEVKRDNEIFESADDSQKSRFNSMLGSLSFCAVFAVLASVLLSLPFILITSEYVNSVIAISTYFTVCFSVIVLILALIYLTCKKPYMSWITDGECQKEVKLGISIECKRLNIVQISLTALSAILFVMTPYFFSPNDGATPGHMICVGLGLASSAASIVYFVIVTVKHRENRSMYLLSGIRNMFLLPSTILIRGSHNVSWTLNSPGTDGDMIDHIKYDEWNAEYIWYAFIYCLVIFLVFAIIRVIANQKLKHE